MTMYGDNRNPGGLLANTPGFNSRAHEVEARVVVHKLRICDFGLPPVGPNCGLCGVSRGAGRGRARDCERNWR